MKKLLTLPRHPSLRSITASTPRLDTFAPSQSSALNTRNIEPFPDTDHSGRMKVGTTSQNITFLKCFGLLALIGLLPSCVSNDFSKQPNPAVVTLMNERNSFYERHQITIDSVDRIPEVAEKRKIGLGLYDPYIFDQGQYQFTFQYAGSTSKFNSLLTTDPWRVTLDIKGGHTYHVTTQASNNQIRYQIADTSSGTIVQTSKPLALRPDKIRPNTGPSPVMILPVP